MSRTKTKELILCNETLPQLLIIYLSLSFSYIYIEDMCHTFTAFSNQSIDEDHYITAHL